MSHASRLSSAATGAVPQMLTARGVSAATGLCVSLIYRLVQRGQFPAPVRLTARSTRWKASEISAWIETRPRGTSASPNPRAQQQP